MYSQKDERPNVLLIMADQFRTKSMTNLGDGIETPNIDRIRSKSVFFTKAACTAPLCTPSRASLATGKLPHNCGVTVHDANLPFDQVTYYQQLRKAGYRVAVAGKTDLHKMDKTLGKNGPLPVAYHLGFTDPWGETEGKMNSAWYGTDENGKPEPTGPYQRYLLAEGEEKLVALRDSYIDRLTQKPRFFAAPTHLKDEEFIDNFVGRLACSWLDAVDDEAPWHLLVSFPGPHNPWDPPAEELLRLDGKEYPLMPSDDMKGKPTWVQLRAERESKGLTPELLNNTKQHYDACIQVIDKQIGAILDKLEEHGLTQNTIVIFTADHGELMGDHGLFEKKAMYEGALRVPLLVHLPGMKKSMESNELASLMDLAPTILDLCKADYSRSDMDALSLLPLLLGEKSTLRPVQISELQNTTMLYDGRYKWIRNINDCDELYDLETDPDELHNIFDSQPEIVKRFSKFTYRQ